MSPFTHPDLARLTRVIAALRQGQTIALPFVPHLRGTFSEEIRLRKYRDDSDGEEILHRTIHRTRSGREIVSRFEPVEWSIDDLLAMTADWPEETLAALPDLTSIADAPCYAVLRRLDAGETVVFSGVAFELRQEVGTETEASETRRAAIWASTPVNAAYTASELASYAPR